MTRIYHNDMKNHLDPKKILALFEKDGKIGLHIPNFESRLEQQEMVKNIIDAYNDNKVALIEAGTGTGKSMAYLVPAMYWAIQSNEKTLISTNTINLQEQLLNKDIPLLAKALNLDIQAVLVKGMSNYVCLRKIQDAQIELTLFPSEEQKEMRNIEMWANSTRDGTKSELNFVPNPATWEKVCAEGDLCNKEKCEFFNKCHFFNARKKAKEAHILISNHSLLFSDLACRGTSEKGNGILPDYQKIILDEAHNIEDIATDHFALKVSGIHLLRILMRLQTDKQGKTFGKLPTLYRTLLRAFGHEASQNVQAIYTKMNLEIPGVKKELIQSIHETFGNFAEFIQAIYPSENSEDPDGTGLKENKLRLHSHHHTHPLWKENIFEESNKLISNLTKFIHLLFSLVTDVINLKDDKLKEQTESVCTEITVLANRLESFKGTIENFIKNEFPKDKVKWVEVKKYRAQQHVELIDASLEISELLVKYLFRKFPTTILCSATLTTNNYFKFVRGRLGLVPELLGGKPVTENMYQSPFDYPKQAILTIPTDLPDPSDPNFFNEAIKTIYTAIQASHGNAFVLFTSYSSMRYCHSLIQEKLKLLKFPLLMQGQNTRKQLLHEFKTVDRSVLFATDSFWEGVDVAGEALRCVIIVKLPFQVPNEPLIQARMEAISGKGGNPFFDYSIPNAIVKFKQGFGRLIRKKNDRGCIICLDSRLMKKPYGKFFLNSLPNCQKYFIDSPTMFKAMTDFYRKTFYLTKQ